VVDVSFVSVSASSGQRRREERGKGAVSSRFQERLTMMATQTSALWSLHTTWQLPLDRLAVNGAYHRLLYSSAARRNASSTDFTVS
jgi:hypothetical protein